MRVKSLCQESFLLPLAKMSKIKQYGWFPTARAAQKTEIRAGLKFIMADNIKEMFDIALVQKKE